MSKIIVVDLMDEATRQKTALAFFNAAQKMVCNLAGRWNAEKDYEDIEEYRTVIADFARKKYKGVAIEKMTKRPFGFYFTLGGCTYQVRQTMTKYSYKRVK